MSHIKSKVLGYAAAAITIAGLLAAVTPAYAACDASDFTEINMSLWTLRDTGPFRTELTRLQRRHNEPIVSAFLRATQKAEFGDIRDRVGTAFRCDPITVTSMVQRHFGQPWVQKASN